MNSNYLWECIVAYVEHCKEVNKSKDEEHFELLFSKPFKAMNKLLDFDESLSKKLIETYVKVLLRTNQWDENKITECIIDDILDSFEERTSLKTKLNVFKLDKKGNAENKFGDIAIIVRNVIDEHTIIEGVGFIEAKRDYQQKDGSYSYQELKKEQMKKYLKNTTSSFYCFYSHQHFFPMLSTDFIDKHLAALKINSSNYSDKYIYSSINPETLLAQINRFKNGYDLDRNEMALSIAKGYEKNIGLPGFIIDIQTLNNENQLELFLRSESIEINQNEYSQYRTDASTKKNDDFLKDNDNSHKPKGPRMR